MTHSFPTRRSSDLNILDRGFGHTPYGNRAQYISGLEIVLADGRVLRTGFGHFDMARSSHLFPYGIGPALDGLFVRSSLGIVNAIGIWLDRKGTRLNSSH